MKKKILIIRSVSFQQLDKNITAIVERFPEQDYLFYLLTHAHGIERSRSYQSLSKIIDYESRKNFTFFHIPSSIKRDQIHYDAVIVPVTNISAAGFLNVFAMALRIPAKKVFICNLVSDIWEISKGSIVGQLVNAVFFASLSTVLLVPLAILSLPLLSYSLVFKKKR